MLRDPGELEEENGGGNDHIPLTGKKLPKNK